MFSLLEDLNLQLDDGRHDNSPREIGNWVFQKLLGDGAFAKVRKAVNIITKQQAAVKIVNIAAVAKELGRSKKRIRKQTMREIKILKALQHPYIVELYEVFEENDHIYIVTELAEGGDLYEYLTYKDKFSERRARQYFRQLVSALEYCHAHMIIHRDMKLENILLDKKMDTIKLTDFGLSSAAQPGQLMRTITGSAYYVAPEVLESSGYDGPASDVWSLGVVLYACVCGVLPFMGNGEEDLHTTLKDAKAGRFKIPRSMSPECEDLIRKMLQPSPTERISIAGIRQHPWTNIGYNEPPPCHLPAYPPAKSLDPEILVRMTFLGFSSSDLQQLLTTETKPCQEIAMYHYLLQQKQEQEARKQRKMNSKQFAKPKMKIASIRNAKRDTGAAAKSCPVSPKSNTDLLPCQRSPKSASAGEFPEKMMSVPSHLHPQVAATSAPVSPRRSPMDSPRKGRSSPRFRNFFQSSRKKKAKAAKKGKVGRKRSNTSPESPLSEEAVSDANSVTPSSGPDEEAYNEDYAAGDVPCTSFSSHPLSRSAHCLDVPAPETGTSKNSGSSSLTSSQPSSRESSTASSPRRRTRRKKHGKESSSSIKERRKRSGSSSSSRSKSRGRKSSSRGGSSVSSRRDSFSSSEAVATAERNKSESGTSLNLKSLTQKLQGIMN